MKNILIYSTILLLVYLASGCATKHFALDHIDNKSIQVSNVENSSSHQLQELINPYKKVMDSLMNDTLAMALYRLDKNPGQSLLGNWVCDGIKWYMDSVAHYTCHVAACNYGGIRIKSLYEGPIRTKDIYELMPFDNAIVIVKLTRSQTDSFINRISGHGFWPISKEANIVVDKKNNTITHHIESIKDTSYIAISDYIANGGDKMDMLIGCPRIETTVKIRDILIAYSKHQKRLAAYLDNRIIYKK